MKTTKSSTKKESLTTLTKSEVFSDNWMAAMNLQIDSFIIRERESSLDLQNKSRLNKSTLELFVGK